MYMYILAWYYYIVSCGLVEEREVERKKERGRNGGKEKGKRKGGGRKKEKERGREGGRERERDYCMLLLCTSTLRLTLLGCINKNVFSQ